MTNQDQRVEALLKLIEEKKASIAEKDVSVKFLTKKILTFEGHTSNFNVMSKEAIVILIGKLNSVINAIKSYDEDLFEYAIIDGHHVEDWIHDLKAQLNSLIIKEEKRILKTLESKLDSFFSEQKKQQMELDEIESFLKGGTQ